MVGQQLLEEETRYFRDNGSGQVVPGGKVVEHCGYRDLRRARHVAVPSLLEPEAGSLLYRAAQDLPPPVITRHARRPAPRRSLRIGFADIS